jgi:hypothetical protein
MAGEYSRELSAKVFAGQCRLIELGYRQGGTAGFGLRRVLLDMVDGKAPRDLPPGDTDELARRGFGVLVGLRIDWADGFGLIRASNTTPVLVLRFEGHTQAALERIEHAMLALLREVKPGAQIQSAAH